MCPYHLSLPSLSLSLSRLSWAVPRPLLILSSFVTPSEYLNIFNSATSSSFSCPLLNASHQTIHQSWFYYCLVHFSFHHRCYSLIAKHFCHSFQLFHPACTLFFTSLLHSPLLCTKYPRYLNSFTFATSNYSIFIVPLFPISFIHMYSVLLLLTFIPHFSNAYLSRLASTCCLCSLQMTILSANIMVQVSPCRWFNPSTTTLKAQVIHDFLQESEIEILEHPPYSLDLAPSDFWLFLNMKEPLRGRKFETVGFRCRHLAMEPVDTPRAIFHGI